MRNNIIIGSITMVLLSAIIVMAGIPILQESTYAETIVKTEIEAQLALEQAAENDIQAALQNTDEITTVLCGTASPLEFGPAYGTRAQTCTAVFVNGQFLLFDVGDRALTRLTQLDMPIEETDAVFITHYHNDHLADLGELNNWSWIGGREYLLPVYGPTGIDQIVTGFNMAYELDQEYRPAHHGEELVPSQYSDMVAMEFEAPPEGEAMVVYENEGVVVKTFTVSHDPVDPAIGYRIEYAGKVIVISGDTIRTETLEAQSQDADLLVAEVMNKAAVARVAELAGNAGQTRNSQLLLDTHDYHMDVADVGNLATDANVKRLALNHLAPVPADEDQLNLWFTSLIEPLYEGELFVGDDGLTIVIPVE